MSLADLLIKVAVIKSRTVTSSYGSETVSYGIIISSYDCRIYSIKPRLVRKQTGEEVEVSTRAVGMLNSLIVEGCLLIVDGITYEIVSVPRVCDAVGDHHLEMNLVKRYDI